MRHFDAHAYRTEDADGVWDFARGCMRSYLILAAKARRFHEDPQIQEALRAAKADQLEQPTVAGDATSDAISALRAESVDLTALGAQGYGNERLDQLVTELLLGAR
jgi:xylose isomerase